MPLDPLPDTSFVDRFVVWVLVVMTAVTILCLYWRVQ